MNKDQQKQQEEINKQAIIEFENVGDEGLFPNHSDKDIWMKGFQSGYIIANQKEISDEEIEKAWISYQRECLEKFEKDTTIAGYAITNKEKFAKWYREQLINKQNFPL
jgi:hypothetical protein